MSKYQATPMESPDYTFDFNDYSMPSSDRSTGFIDGRVSYADLGTWRASRPFDQHSVSVDPSFVNAGASDFHLKTGSLCKAAGKSGEDLGAYPRGNDGTVIGQSPATGVSIRNRATHPKDPLAEPARGYIANGRVMDPNRRSLENGQLRSPMRW